MRAGVALGSNVGDRLAHLREARRRIESLTSAAPPMLASTIYETEPVGCEPDARSFLNAVVELSYSGAPVDLLGDLRKIEAALGRSGNHTQNAPRTIDLDLLYFGDLTSDTSELQLPHPRISERRFVLTPLCEVRPDLVLAGQKLPVRRLLAALADRSNVVPFSSQW